MGNVKKRTRQELRIPLGTFAAAGRWDTDRQFTAKRSLPASSASLAQARGTTSSYFFSSRSLHSEAWEHWPAFCRHGIALALEGMPSIPHARDSHRESRRVV